MAKAISPNSAIARCLWCGSSGEERERETEPENPSVPNNKRRGGEKEKEMNCDYSHSCLTAIESLSSLEKAVGAAPPPRPAAAMAERLLTGEALALAEVELVILVGAAGVGVDPFVAAPVADLPGDVPLMFFVASLTSWNFSINCWAITKRNVRQSKQHWQTSRSSSRQHSGGGGGSYWKHFSKVEPGF